MPPRPAIRRGERHINPPTGSDRDEPGERCDHLMIWRESAGEVDQLDAIHRLPPHCNTAVARVHGLYARPRFNPIPLERLPAGMVAAGRACLHRDDRNGTVIFLLWNAIRRYMGQRRNRYVLGCSWVRTLDGGADAATWDHVVTGLRCRRPCSPVELGDLPRGARPAVRGYLRSGAVARGRPAVDKVFQTIDLP